jgi:hypothetical protein
MSEDTKLGTSAIPEIYYDLIARIVPGALFLSVYGWKQIDERFDAGKLSFALILSYLIGLVLNLLAGRFWHFAFFKRRKRLGKRAQTVRSDGELWLWIRNLSPGDRNRYTKMIAEKMLFSSLSIASLITSLVILVRPPYECAFHDVSRCYSVIPIAFFAFFSWCMFRINEKLTAFMELEAAIRVGIRSDPPVSLAIHLRNNHQRC